MKISKKTLLGLIATFTTMIAAMVASSACLWFSYQPEEPKCLNED